MIDGYRCYGSMSPLEQRRWQRNTFHTNTKRVLMGEYWTFTDFMIDSFIWSDTKEGFDYWCRVSEKYILHDLLTPQPRYHSLKLLRPVIWP
jgi:hypothetical protein